MFNHPNFGVYFWSRNLASESFRMKHTRAGERKRCFSFDPLKKITAPELRWNNIKVNVKILWKLRLSGWVDSNGFKRYLHKIVFNGWENGQKFAFFRRYYARLKKNQHNLWHFYTALNSTVTEKYSSLNNVRISRTNPTVNSCSSAQHQSRENQQSPAPASHKNKKKSSVAPEKSPTMH